MNFTVKYRGADGALKTEVVDAASRADVFAQMKARGITPTTVVEGGKRAPATASTSSSPRPAWLKGAVAGLVVVVTAVAAWFFLMPAEKPQQKPEPAPKPKVEKPKPAPRNNKIVPRPPVTNTAPVGVSETVPSAQDPSKRYHKGVEVVSSQSKTNKNGTVVEKLKLANGKTIERVIPKKPIFDTPSDQLIALALSAQMGKSMPPLPGLGSVDHDFAASLANPITISPDDTPEVRDLKLRVKEARAYIAAEVGNGRTVRQCLEEHCQRMAQIADDHQMALEQIVKMRQEGASAEDIAKFRERVNELFRDKGTPELPVPQRRTSGHSKSSSQNNDSVESQAGSETMSQP